MAIVLYLVSRTRARAGILAAAVIGMVSVLIVVFGNVRLAAKEGVTINYKEAMSGRSDLDADVEISSFYNFDGEDIGLSIWKPQNTDGPAPVVVFIHGGGWASGDRFMTYVTSHCRYFADHGYMAVSVDYPLSTDERHLWNRQEEVCGRAVAWLGLHAAEYGGDASRVYLTGESGGGNLSINVASRINSWELAAVIGEAIPKITAVAALYPATDPAAVYDHADPLLRGSQVDLLTKHFGGSPEEYPERYAAITSANLTGKDNTPPVLIVYGNRDHYVPGFSTRAFIADMEQKGIENKTIIVPFSDHIFDLMPGNIGAQIYEQSAIKWFGQYQ